MNKEICGKIRAGILNIRVIIRDRDYCYNRLRLCTVLCNLQDSSSTIAMSFDTDSPLGPLGKLHKFVAVNETFGYVENVETAYEVLREFETITTTRFCLFYSKDFGKQDQGKRKNML